MNKRPRRNSEMLDNLDELETIVCEKIECLICTDKFDTFKKVKCCSNKICLDCASNWFERSVFCPFCKHDQRETPILPQRETSDLSQLESEEEC
jgi:hypothetical protein